MHKNTENIVLLWVFFWKWYTCTHIHCIVLIDIIIVSRDMKKYISQQYMLVVSQNLLLHYLRKFNQINGIYNFLLYFYMLQIHHTHGQNSAHLVP